MSFKSNTVIQDWVEEFLYEQKVMVGKLLVKLVFIIGGMAVTPHFAPEQQITSFMKLIRWCWVCYILFSEEYAKEPFPMCQAMQLKAKELLNS